MDINYELYKVFYYVATTLSFSEASRHLFISQSAVSQSIKALEKKLGQPLFVRSTKKVKLTPAGELLLKHIEPAVHLIGHGEAQLMESRSLGLGQLHIGASDTICRYFLVPYLNEFHKKYPTVPIKVTNATSLTCVDLLEQGKVDMIVTNSPNPRLNQSYIDKTVAEFHDVFIANPDYFPFTEKEIRLQKLTDYPLIVLERNCTTTEFLRRLFLQHHLELMPAIELSSNDLLIDLARIGLGIAFVPDYCVQNASDDLTVLRIRESMPARQMTACVNPSMPVNESTRNFLELLPTVQS